jgi:hypothetical protein
VEFELAWAPHLLSTVDYTYRERHCEAIYRFEGGMLPSDFFRRNVVLGFQEDVIGVDNMMWAQTIRTARRLFPNRARSWRACRTTNRPSLPRTTIRGSPAATPPACTILTWRG